MGKATAEQIKEGIQVLTGKPDFNQKYKNVDNTSNFDNLCSALEVWLEDKDYGDLGDKKLVAQVINQHFPAKFSFGRAEKIGEYARSGLTPLITVAPAGPVYTNLNQSWRADSPEYSKVRQDVARVLAVSDAGHRFHGGNFSGTQTLRQIISNLVEKVQGQSEVARVRAAVLQHYHLTL